jgi:hydroxymethylpyrimidine/phosphomethylpyrimidine kinase
MNRCPIVLTIAGSDSIAGAGVQADLKTFAALGVYGVSALTAVTAQNTMAVSEVVPLAPALVESQINQIARDVEIAAVKTGMLATVEITEAVADVAGRLRWPNLVVDPVMVPTTGGVRTLLAPEAVSVMRARLLPLATVVTPNVSEASELSGITVDSIDTAKEAARRIASLGPAAVVVKGGHLAGREAIDVLYHAGRFIEFAAPRAEGAVVHGTGCTFASAIAAGLALGDDVPVAVRRAKTYVTGAIEHALQVGHGSRVPNHGWER